MTKNEIKITKKYVNNTKISMQYKYFPFKSFTAIRVRDFILFLRYNNVSIYGKDMIEFPVITVGNHYVCGCCLVSTTLATAQREVWLTHLTHTKQS